MKSNNKKAPWPTKDAMEQIYSLNLWGGSEHEFYSGAGSHEPEIIEPYLKKIGSFLASFKNPLTICDLGCGDFNIGKNLTKYTKNYIGVDIVKDLIEHNTKTFANKNIEFHCLDIAQDTLPIADCAVVRQVLQHLSNKEVSSVLKKLKLYKYVLLTEHLPNGSFEANKDIISGQGIRIKKKSGLQLTQAPFSFKALKEEELLRVELENNKGVIITTLYTLF